MNVTIKQINSNNKLSFWTNAPKETIQWISKVNENREDMIFKHDGHKITHPLGWLPYHLMRNGYNINIPQNDDENITLQTTFKVDLEKWKRKK